MLQIKHLTAPQKMSDFQFYIRRAKWPWREKIFSGPQRGQKNCESKETNFSYSLEKAFHLPEFRTKLYFT